MSRYVVDASVAIRWYVEEIHSIHALQLLEAKNILLAPDLILPEVGNILWKRVRMSDLSLEIAQLHLVAFTSLDLTLVPSIEIISQAFEIASTLDCSVYDSLYVSVAILREARLVTADRKMYNTLIASRLKDFVIWIENIEIIE